MRHRFIIPSGSIVLAVTTLLSYGAGLLRDRTFAHMFGASRALDAYNAAFVIPDFLFNVFVASGIAAAVVPLYTSLLRGGRADAETYANTIITAAVSAMAVLAGLVIIFAGSLSRLAAPGFSAVDRALVAHLMRLLAFSPLLFAASNALGALLTARQRFLAYGLSPVLYNAGIIAGTFLLAPRYGIVGTVFGTLVGAAFHLALRAAAVWRLGMRFRVALRLRSAAFKQTVRLMLPKMVGHPVELATFWSFTAIASRLSPGSIAVLNFARNVQSVPVSVVGIAVGTATFPLLAQAAARGSADQFRRVLKPSVWLILAASVAAAAFTFIVRKPLIEILLGGRAFGPDDVARTASVLAVFTLAIPTEALAQLLARAFYATKNTAVPVALSVVSLVISVGGGFALAPRLGLEVLPFSFAVGSAVKLIALMFFLPLRLRRLSTAETSPASS